MVGSYLDSNSKILAKIQVQLATVDIGSVGYSYSAIMGVLVGRNNSDSKSSSCVDCVATPTGGCSPLALPSCVPYREISRLFKN
mmetsp:Transcript_20383/g.47881  ORF Transcript_20383/g.47881 Transcript_20383/m.47881 type:complete len:84 (-) Transcript_20383:60-311(-)